MPSAAVVRACGAALQLAAGMLFVGARADAAITFGKSAAVELLHMPEVSDFGMASLYIFIGYTFQYIASAGLFELTNPFGVASKTLSPAQLERRRTQVKRELLLGVGAMVANVVVTMMWMRWIEPHVWTYAYFARTEYSILWCLASIPMYMFFFDLWFYATHRWLHESQYLWDRVHRHHHSFKEPSAFAQDAVHPFEAVLQGPLGHFFPTLFFPIHPIAHAAFGFLSSVFAVAAHDGRTWDLNNHYYHHCAGQGRRNSFNYSLYWPLWDRIFDTRYMGEEMDKHRLLKAVRDEADPTTVPESRKAQ